MQLFRGQRLRLVCSAAWSGAGPGREARARTRRGLPKSSFSPRDGVIARLNGSPCFASVLQAASYHLGRGLKLAVGQPVAAITRFITGFASIHRFAVGAFARNRAHDAQTPPGLAGRTAPSAATPQRTPAAKSQASKNAHPQQPSHKHDTVARPPRARDNCTSCTRRRRTIRRKHNRKRLHDDAHVAVLRGREDQPRALRRPTI